MHFKVFAAILLFLGACSAPQNSFFSQNNRNYANTSHNDDLKSKLRSIVNSNECKSQSSCQWVIAQVNNENTSNLTKKTILVIDTGMKLTALTLYADRIKGFYKWNGTRLIQYYPKIRVPKPYFDFMKELAKDTSLQDKEIDELKKALLSKLKPYMSQLRNLTQHGDPIFNTLARANPNHDFILVEPLNAPTCFDPKSESIEDEKLQHSHFAQAIRKLTIEHNVKLINLSRGWSVPEVERLCPDKNYTTSDYQAYIEAIKPYYMLLGSIEKVLLIQASQNEIDELAYQQQPWKYHLDCLEIPNRIRVGWAIIDSSTQIEKDGSNNLSLIADKSQISFAACTDMYIATASPTDFAHSSHFLTTIDGLLDVNFGSSTSYLTPIALSYINYLLDTGRTPAMVKNSVKPNSSPKIFDPVSNGAFIVNKRLR